MHAVVSVLLLMAILVGNAPASRAGEVKPPSHILPAKSSLACSYHENPGNEPNWLGRRIADFARKSGYNPSRDDLKAFERVPRKLSSVSKSIRAAQVLTTKICGNDGNGAYDGTESNALFHAFMAYFLVVLEGDAAARDFMLGHEMTARMDKNTLMDLTNNSWGFHLASQQDLSRAREVLSALTNEFKLLKRKSTTDTEVQKADALTREKANLLIQDSIELLNAGVFDVLRTRGSGCAKPSLYPNMK